MDHVSNFLKSRCFDNDVEKPLTCRILGRWLRALGRPNSILDKAKRVQEIIVDIRRLCDELLDKNVHSIKQLNIGKSLPRYMDSIDANNIDRTKSDH